MRILVTLMLVGCTGAPAPKPPAEPAHTDLAAFAQEACGRQGALAADVDPSVPVLPGGEIAPPAGAHLEVRITKGSVSVAGREIVPTQVNPELQAAVAALRASNPGEPIVGTVMADADVNTGEVATTARMLGAHTRAVFLVGRAEPAPLPVADADRPLFDRTRAQLAELGAGVQPAARRAPVVQSVASCPALQAFLDRDGLDVCSQIAELQAAQEGCTADLGAVAAWIAPEDGSGFLAFKRVDSPIEGQATWGEDLAR